MGTGICTLFEGDYHHGLAGLVNSLCRHGYHGVVWAGYRGALPPWARPLERIASGDEFRTSTGCSIRFVSVNVENHLTNHKPDFMRRLWKCEAADANRLFYFDPDIVIKCDWAFFEDWVEGGVALCEDVNSPMLASHPIRNTWRRFYAARDIPLARGFDSYVNGGFIGLKREHGALLETWSRMLTAFQQETGSLDRLLIGSRPYAFYNADQDVLNAALMACDVPVSMVGKEGMDFIPGGYIMSHAIGSAKPWSKPLLRSALGGRPPSQADKNYWQNVRQPIQVWSSARWWLRRLELAAASAVGRLWRRA